MSRLLLFTDRMSSQSQLPAITLPRPPPLCTRRHDKTNSKPVPLQVCGWSFAVGDLVQWADEFGIGAGLANHIKEQLAMREIGERLPVGHRRMTCVYDDAAEKYGGINMCYVIGSNQTPEDLEKAQDKALIDQFRIALGWTDSPKWYYYARN